MVRLATAVLILVIGLLGWVASEAQVTKPLQTFQKLMLIDSKKKVVEPILFFDQGFAYVPLRVEANMAAHSTCEMQRYRGH